MNDSIGIKHIIECHCIMPQYRRMTNPPYHQFKVFSIIDASNQVIPKHAACTNCGVIHNVIDLQKSEILAGEEVGAVMKKDDCKLMLPGGIVQILETYDCEVCDWEHALFILQNEKWGEYIIVSREETDLGDISGKLLNINGPGQYRLEPFFSKRTI